MRVSVFNGKQANQTGLVDEVVEVDFNALQSTICNNSWAPGIFKEGVDTKTGQLVRRRLKGNLESIEVLTVDIDSGLSLNEAKSYLKEIGYTAFIGTTRHHQLEKKSGDKITPPCDRFRICIPFDKPITDNKTYESTWVKAKELFPALDISCCDSSRFYYQCSKIVYSQIGKPFPVSPHNQHTTDSIVETSNISAEKIVRGNLARSTHDFISQKPSSDSWHIRLYKAGIDLKQNLYSKEESIHLLTCASPNKTLDAEDLRQINDIYENRTPRHPPRFQVPNYNGPNYSGPVILLNRVYERSSKEERLAQLENDRAIREKALKNATPFLSNAFDGIISLMLGLYLIAGCSGKGKSSLAATIITYFLKFSKKDIIVVTNEDSAEDVLSRIACLQLSMNWKKYRRNDLSPESTATIRRQVEALVANIEVVSIQENGWDMTVLEDVIAVLNCANAHHEHVGLIVVDYLQTVSVSRNNPKLEPFQVSKALGTFLKDYGRRTPIPVVMLSQLKPSSKSSDFSDRIQNDRTFFNHAHTVIEVIPDFETGLTEFVIHKDRWGEATGRCVVTEWKHGRYENPTGFKNNVIETVQHKEAVQGDLLKYQDVVEQTNDHVDSIEKFSEGAIQ